MVNFRVHELWVGVISWPCPPWDRFEQPLRLVGDPATRFFSSKFSWKSLRRSWSLLELLGSLSSQQRLKGWTGHVRYGVRLVKKGLALGLWSLHTWMSGWCRETQPSISAIYHMCIMFLIDSMFGNIHIYRDLTWSNCLHYVSINRLVSFILIQSGGLAYFPIMSLE